MQRKSKQDNRKGKVVYIRTYGCQMNKYDSQVMEGILTGAGYEVVQSEEKASVVLFNTCSVREHAEQRVFGVLGQLKRLKKENPDLILGVCGCMAQRLGSKLLQRMSHVDLVCGTEQFDKLPELIEQVRGKQRGAGHIVAVSENEEFITPGLSHLDEKVKHSAFVSVMRGCESYCAYCIVPYVRGREKSRKPVDIVREVKYLADKGVCEVTLLGQNVLAYGKRQHVGADFSTLLEMINEVEGIERIRFITSHPRDVTEQFLRVMAELPKVCEYLHLPVQAGSTRVLKTMNRGYTPRYYRERVEKARRLMPGLGLSTDFIVGFPGESEEDFAETYSLMEKLCFDSAYLFKYSIRSGTRAAVMPDDVPREKKEERLEKLLRLQERVGKEVNSKLIGQRMEVMVDAVSKRDQNCVIGKTRSNKSVVFAGSKKLIGSLCEVEITGAGPASLKGVLVA